MRTRSYLYFRNIVLLAKYLISLTMSRDVIQIKFAKISKTSVYDFGLKLCNRRSTNRIESLFLAFILREDYFANLKRHIITINWLAMTQILYHGIKNYHETRNQSKVYDCQHTNSGHASLIMVW